MSVVSSRCQFGLVHAVTFQKSRVGKDILYVVGKGDHVLLAREGRRLKIIAIFMLRWLRWFRSDCSGGSVPVAPAVPVVSFRWLRRFRSGVPDFITCPKKPSPTERLLLTHFTPFIPFLTSRPLYFRLSFHVNDLADTDQPPKNY